MQFYIVDVFAETALSGNQLAVFRGNPDDAMMLAIAREMNFSETTFITSDDPRDGGYDVRIFTPNQELPFAGHPTLGTAYVIMQEIATDASDRLILNERVGPIAVNATDDGVLWMQQNPPEFGQRYDVDDIAQALQLDATDIDTRYPIQEVSTGLPFVICPLRTLKAVKRANIDMPQFQSVLAARGTQLGAEAIYIFAPEAEEPENDFHARCFVGLLAGPPEDPATGSASGCFAGYLMQHDYCGESQINKRVEQGYEIGRPSLIRLEAEAGPPIQIRVGGRVQMVARGEWAAKS